MVVSQFNIITFVLRDSDWQLIVFLHVNLSFYHFKLKQSPPIKLFDICLSITIRVRVVFVIASHSHNRQCIPQLWDSRPLRQIESYVIEVIYANEWVLHFDIIPNVLRIDCNEVIFCALAEANISLISLIIAIIPQVYTLELHVFHQLVVFDTDWCYWRNLNQLKVKQHPLVFQCDILFVFADIWYV